MTSQVVPIKNISRNVKVLFFKLGTRVRLERGTKDSGHAENVLVVSLQFRSPSGG